MAIQDNSHNTPANTEKTITPSKKEKFYGSTAFQNILVDAVTTAGVVNNAGKDHKGMKYYLDMVDSALERDARPIETMLMTQACTLDLLFNKLVYSAQTSEHLEGREIYFNMAVKAQKQCRQTLLALRDIQHPRRTTFVNQQNNALNQQVNNNRTEKDFSKNSANELLTEAKHETMDTGRTAETVTAHP